MLYWPKYMKTRRVSKFNRIIKAVGVFSLYIQLHPYSNYFITNYPVVNRVNRVWLYHPATPQLTQLRVLSMYFQSSYMRFGQSGVKYRVIKPTDCSKNGRLARSAPTMFTLCGNCFQRVSRVCQRDIRSKVYVRNLFVSIPLTGCALILSYIFMSYDQQIKKSSVFRRPIRMVDFLIRRHYGEQSCNGPNVGKAITKCLETPDQARSIFSVIDHHLLSYFPNSRQTTILSRSTGGLCNQRALSNLI